jgi:hypothetical protein
MSIYDSRSDLQKSIDQYVYVLQVACGEKNPIRRKAFEVDINYALQTVEPYKSRYSKVFEYDLFAIDENCDVAVEKVNGAIAVLQSVGAGEGVPAMLENPHIVLAECAMTLVDTLRSLGAFDAEAVEILIDDIFTTFDEETVSKVMDRRLKIFIYRYINEKIPEAVLDSIAMDDDALQQYLRTL